MKTNLITLVTKTSCFILLILFNNSCNFHSIRAESADIELTVKEAKDWYDAYSKSQNSSRRKGSEYLQRFPIWELANIETERNGNVWIPIAYNKNFRPVLTICLQ